MSRPATLPPGVAGRRPLSRQFWRGLSDGVIRLDPPTIDDIRAILAGMDAAVLRRFRAWTGYDLVGELRPATWWRLAESGDIRLAIRLCRTGELIGRISLFPYLDTEGASGDIWIAAPYRGRDYAVRAADLGIRLAFHRLRYPWIIVLAEEDNSAPVPVLRALGFRLLHTGLFLGNLWGLSADDWRPRAGHIWRRPPKVE